MLTIDRHEHAAKIAKLSAWCAVSFEMLIFLSRFLELESALFTSFCFLASSLFMISTLLLLEGRFDDVGQTDIELAYEYENGTKAGSHLLINCFGLFFVACLFVLVDKFAGTSSPQAINEKVELAKDIVYFVFAISGLVAFAATIILFLKKGTIALSQKLFQKGKRKNDLVSRYHGRLEIASEEEVAPKQEKAKHVSHFHE